VLGAQAWWRQNAGFLARELADPNLCIDSAPRFLVIGLDILADSLEELRRIRVEGLCVSQLCSFTAGGRLRLGLTTMLGSDPTAAAVGRAGFTVPAGIVDPGQRALVARFLDLMRRVDSGMTATGDRFSRRLFLGGRYVAQLGLLDGKLSVEFPALADGFEGAWSELTESTCLAAVDRMLRVVLAIELVGDSDGNPDEDAAVDREDPPVADPDRKLTAALESGAEAGARTPDVAAPGDPDASESRALAISNVTPADGVVAEEDRFSLEPIRRSVARAQLSREEFSALGDERSDSE
jgi:hypothetical protein